MHNQAFVIKVKYETWKKSLKKADTTMQPCLCLLVLDLFGMLTGTIDAFFLKKQMKKDRLGMKQLK